MLSTEQDSKKPSYLVHSDHGDIPAKILLDCVFALAPGGQILHHHAEEFDIAEQNGALLLSVNGNAPNESRSRCQIIPPRIPEFPKSL